jgi:hypothetical protein
MSPNHYILIPGANHSPKIKQMIEKGIIQEGKSYPIDRTPTLYDPLNFSPSHKWMLHLTNNDLVILEMGEFSESFTTIQNWRHLQICKLTEEPSNQPLIEYINYLTHHLLIIKEELIKNPLKDHDILEESQIIGNQIKIIKEKLLINETPLNISQ